MCIYGIHIKQTHSKPGCLICFYLLFFAHAQGRMLGHLVSLPSCLWSVSRRAGGGEEVGVQAASGWPPLQVSPLEVAPSPTELSPSLDLAVTSFSSPQDEGRRGSLAFTSLGCTCGFHTSLPCLCSKTKHLV